MASTPIRRPRPRERESMMRGSPGMGGGAGEATNSSDLQASAAATAFVPRGGETTTPLEALAVAFWGSRLRANQFRDGDALVDYDALWPSGDELKRAVQDFNQSELEYAMLDCCRLTVLCGPVRVLREMLEAKVVGVDQMFQPHGVTLIHMACVAQLPDMVSMLKDFEPSYKKDLLKRTAQELCRDRATRDRFPPLHRMGGAFRRSVRAGSAVAKAIAKSEVFKIATEPMKCVELLIQIQNLDFDVNEEKNEDGDYLVHVIVECGIAQIPTLLCLQRLCKADFNLYSDDGLTPLCIAAQDGCLYLIELLVCILGASPNKANCMNGWTPLHYAASQCHPEAVLALIRRGALVNLECSLGSLPDDVIPRSNPNYRETLQLLTCERSDRVELLTVKARNGTLHWSDVHKSDQFVINSSGNTLLMEAALLDRSGAVSLLCGLEGAPVNAQHFKTGQTAAAMCAAGGNVGSLQQLLKHGADPRIVDIDGKIALHHACVWRSIDCVTELLRQKNGFFGLASARQYTKDVKVLFALDEAQKRRQEEIIKPMLFECVATGDLETLGAFEWEEGDNVNVVNSYSEWPILLAAQNGHVEIVRMLHKLGGKVNHMALADSGNTPLHAACKYGRLSVVDFLLNFTTSQTSAGSQLSSKQLANSEELLDINHRDAFGHTTLELAVSQGHAKVIERLCKRGASCTLPDSSGHLLSSPFMGVQVMLKEFRRQHMKAIVSTFLKRKDYPRLKQLWMSPHDHSLRNENEESSLMVACSSGARMEVIHFLLSDIVQKTPSAEELSRNRPASAAPSLAYQEAAAAANFRSSTPIGGLLSPRSNGGSSDSKKKQRRVSSYDSLTSPMHRSSTMQSLEPVLDEGEEEGQSGAANRKLDFGEGTDSDSSQQANGKPDLAGGFDSLLVRPPSPISVSALDLDDRRGGAHLDAQLSFTESEHSALSISGGSLHMLPWREPLNDLLLAQGRDGGTALHRAVAASFVDAVKALMEADARIVNIADLRGNTAMHLACILRHNKIIRLLLKCPTIVLNQQNIDYHLPEDVAPRSLVKEISSKRMALTDGEVKRPRKASTASNVLGPTIRHDSASLSATGGATGAGTPGSESVDMEDLERKFNELKETRTGRMTPRPGAMASQPGAMAPQPGAMPPKLGANGDGL